MTNDEIQRTIRAKIGDIDYILGLLRGLLVGKRIRIISDFNGQPRGGTSKPRLTGHETTITSVHYNGRIFFFLKSEHNWCGIEPDELEFID